ncbi:hypothetical protein GYMLUDRAFT_649460 [Collybiopsis luxurians FD-317 M1]|nr:hypothetical protein GYMLUDRAFT_649460 [Collybiopsis luxurians FD-317 M1]
MTLSRCSYCYLFWIGSGSLLFERVHYSTQLWLRQSTMRRSLTILSTQFLSYILLLPNDHRAHPRCQGLRVIYYLPRRQFRRHLLR